MLILSLPLGDFSDEQDTVTFCKQIGLEFADSRLSRSIKTKNPVKEIYRNMKSPSIDTTALTIQDLATKCHEFVRAKSESNPSGPETIRLYTELQGALEEIHAILSQVTSDQTALKPPAASQLEDGEVLQQLQAVISDTREFLDAQGALPRQPGPDSPPEVQNVRERLDRCRLDLTQIPTGLNSHAQTLVVSRLQGLSHEVVADNPQVPALGVNRPVNHLICPCQCHLAHRWSSPSRVQPFVGRYQISWTADILGRKCDSSRCFPPGEPSRSRIIIICDWPAWLTSRRMTLTVDRLGKGLRFSLRMPIAIPSDSDVILSCLEGDMWALRQHLAAGLSPFAVDAAGNSLLHVRVTCSKARSSTVADIGP